MQDAESEIQVLKEMNKAIQIQIKTKDTDNQRLNIKIKRLEKTAEIREAIISNAVDSKVTVKNGIPNYNQAVSPRPFKSAARKLQGESPANQPRSLHEMKGTEEESSSATLAPLKKGKNYKNNTEVVGTPGSVSLPPIAGKPPVPDMQPLKKDFK